jgi:hypothetical protein
MAIKRKSMNNYYSRVLIPAFLILIGLAICLPFVLPQEQRATSGQVYRAIQRIQFRPAPILR